MWQHVGYLMAIAHAQSSPSHMLMRFWEWEEKEDSVSAVAPRSVIRVSVAIISFVF